VIAQECLARRGCFWGLMRRVLVFIYTTAMEVTLTPNGEELLRAALARHPGQSPTEVVEQALAERIEREAATEPSAGPQAKKLTPEEFDSWLAEFTQFSNKIPPMPGETFSREMIYQDRD
jgi:hypothetical protein